MEDVKSCCSTFLSLCITQKSQSNANVLLIQSNLDLYWDLNNTPLIGSQHCLPIQLQSERCQITKVTTSVTLEVEHYISNYTNMNLVVRDIIYMASLDLV